MIDTRVANIGNKVNGWLTVSEAGVFGTDYLLRAAVTQIALGSHIAQEALYPVTFTDIEGKPLTGANNYMIHFNAGQIPPVDAFWSITMYNNKSLFVDNSINRYKVGTYTDGLKNNTDGSLDIYIQHASPGADKESNWSCQLLLPLYQIHLVLFCVHIFQENRFSTEHGLLLQ